MIATNFIKAQPVYNKTAIALLSDRPTSCFILTSHCNTIVTKMHLS